MGYWADRAKMSVSGAPGTETITLNAAVSPFRTFANAGVTDGQVVSYLVEEGTAWELGRGTYASSGTTLTRTLVSSSTGSLVSFTSAATVSIVMLSADAIGGPDLTYNETTKALNLVSDAGSMRLGAASDLTLTRPAAAALQLGEANANSSATITVTIASPGVVTWTAHGLTTGSPINFSTTGALPTGITSGTTYYVIRVNADAFQVAASVVNALGGTAINTSGSQSGTHTAYKGPLAQTLSVQSASAGVTNLGGAPFIINGSRGTGSAAGGPIIFQVAPAGSSGTSQNAYATALTIGSDKSVTFAGVVTVDGGTVTTSNPVLNLTQTWNAAGTTFTGLKLNATDTASASGSLLLDLQVGGTSQLKVTKAGAVTVLDTGSITCGNAYIGSNQVYLAGFNSASRIGNAAYVMKANGVIGFDSSTTTANTSDVQLTRAAAATLQLGAADATNDPTTPAVAQTLRVQSVATNANNSNRAGYNFTVQGSAGTGTGAGGSIIFQVAPAGTTGSTKNAYATALTIGSDKTTTLNGSLKLNGASSGTVTVTPASAAGTWTLTLPATTGASGQVLTTDGAGNTTWSTPSASPVTTTSVIGYTIDGGGVALQTGLAGTGVQIPFACTITSWTLLADQTGSVVVDIWKDSYANYPPTSGDSITASAKPAITSAAKNTSSTLTGWTTTVNAGDVLFFNVDSCTTITNVQLILNVTVP